jgi:hypothetical protein
VDSFGHHNEQCASVLEIVHFNRIDGLEDLVLVVLAEEEILDILCEQADISLYTQFVSFFYVIS